MRENPLSKWYKDFIAKRNSIIKKYNLKMPEQIASFFLYKNLKGKEPDFCPLFRKNEKCHNMKEEDFNCFYCGCPFYDYKIWDEENKILGACLLNKSDGVRNQYGYWDCTNCTLPHTSEFVIKRLKGELM